MTTLIISTISLVILYNILILAERRSDVFGAASSFVDRLLRPDLPLVPWPPGYQDSAAVGAGGPSTGPGGGGGGGGGGGAG